tara:strand:+ start:787 stop:1158 length:372 start_codon:yes stop_codon:yes gene_type:complete
MGFKLGSEKRGFRTPMKRTIIRKDLPDGTLAEANNDGSIFVDKDLEVGSRKYNKTIAHEAQHMRDMETGRAAYGENYVTWEGNTYIRREIDGENYIDGPAGRLPEGHPDHPWEKVANEAENNY